MYVYIYYMKSICPSDENWFYRSIQLIYVLRNVLQAFYFNLTISMNNMFFYVIKEGAEIYQSSSFLQIKRLHILYRSIYKHCWLQSYYFKAMISNEENLRIIFVHDKIYIYIYIYIFVNLSQPIIYEEKQTSYYSITDLLDNFTYH